mgnify:FL=1
MTPLNLDRLQHWIDRGLIDPTQPITMKELFESRCVHGIKHGVKLLADVCPDLLPRAWASLTWAYAAGRRELHDAERPPHRFAGILVRHRGNRGTLRNLRRTVREPPYPREFSSHVWTSPPRADSRRPLSAP